MNSTMETFQHNLFFLPSSLHGWRIFGARFCSFEDFRGFDAQTLTCKRLKLHPEVWFNYPDTTVATSPSSSWSS